MREFDSLQQAIIGKHGIERVSLTPLKFLSDVVVSVASVASVTSVASVVSVPVIGSGSTKLNVVRSGNYALRALSCRATAARPAYTEQLKLVATMELEAVMSRACVERLFKRYPSLGDLAHWVERLIVFLTALNL